MGIGLPLGRHTWPPSSGTKAGRRRYTLRTRMRFLLLTALSALPIMGSGGGVPDRYRAWQWERTIQPVPSAPADEQCVVLDADLYAASAPGLRDVRLLQDGREIAYALQESYDERVVHGAGNGDRSVYTTVLRIPLLDKGGLERGTAVLPRHVPVERIELISGVDERAASVPSGVSRGTVRLRLVATPITKLAGAGEVIEDDLEAASPVERTAIGANLQDGARVDVVIHPGTNHFLTALLQMHQRSVCYQPLSSAPLLLLYGNADAPLVRYTYAARYQPRAEALLASLGSARPNASYQPEVITTFTLTRRQRFILATFIAVSAFLLTAMPLLRRR